MLFAIAVSSTLLRSFLRYRASVPLGIDDILLFVAIATLAGTTGVAYNSHDLFYLQVAATIGALPIPPDFGDKMRVFVRCQQAVSMLVWATIYLVKLSFMVFFYKLVNKVRKLELWWRAVFAAILVAGLVSIPLGWIVCADTGPDMFSKSMPRQIIIGKLICFFYRILLYPWYGRTRRNLSKGDNVTRHCNGLSW